MRLTKPLVKSRMLDSSENRIRSRHGAPTLKDVAKHASVSPYTVSAVLNGARSNTRVSEETREKIERAAVELGYRPNAVARSLRNRKTNIIGLYFGYGSLEPHDPFHAEVLTGLQRGCEAFRKDLMIHYSFHHYGTEEVFRELASGKIDGLVLLTAPSDPLVERVRKSGLLVVAITDSLEGIPSVVADDAHGSRMIAEHLAAKGHRKVLYRRCPGESDSANRRYDAFRTAATEVGIEWVEGRTHDWRGKLGAEEIERIARRHELGITAAVCWGDPSANALLHYCFENRIDVPGELAIVGFNGIEPSVEPRLRLTTIRANWADVAQCAVSLLARCIEGEGVPSWTVMPVQFQEGDTT
jgi:DNA-binding LacI/PurR family transcriptional regulator